MSEQVTVIARLRAKAGMEARVRQVCVDLCEPTRAEAGCINYDLHESPDHPHEFMFHENWATAATLDAHLKSPHVQAAFKAMPEILEGPPEITLWKRMSLTLTAGR